MRRRFATLDVFAGKRFTGNPLAVVLDSEGLDHATMQAIAREFNHPETVFVRPPADPKHRASLRIFTPGRELQFAGHPTVGTAVLFGRLDGGKGALEFVLGEGIGPVRCIVEPGGADDGRARFELPRLPEPLPATADDAATAAALDLSPSDLGFEDFRPARWTGGNAFTFVPVKDLAAIARCRPDLTKFDSAFGDSAMVFVFCRETLAPGVDFHARMFAPSVGIFEDPATGSAGAAFTGLIAARGELSDGDHTLTIEQGLEMGRPSLLELTLTIRDRKLATAFIGGQAVMVTEGAIEA